MNEAVGFIGLGNMGEPIAGNILRAGFPLKVFNRTASKAAGLTAQGAKLAASAAEVAERGGIVCTMLADDRAVEEICGGEDSFVKRLGQGGVHVSMSTIAPATARRLATHHKKYGVEYVASPVFGRPEAAAAAKLFVCVAGLALVKKKVQPILRAIGQEIFDFGEDPGSANVVKLCGNFLVASTVAALAEMLVLAEKNGVSKKAMAEMIGKFSPLHYSYASMMAEGRFEPAGFRLALGLKDINLILETAAASVTPLPIASLLRDRWLASMAKGRANLDWSAVILDVAENAGIHAAVGASGTARN
ncbi:MAG TPA: NAD(P)-dependent oxidoreductase [Candidatus Acidoferrales bacterium]|nr:NAD(P)-dependent oxidoreductase [Candidatus Acidoferrales bacterium]